MQPFHTPLVSTLEILHVGVRRSHQRGQTRSALAEQEKEAFWEISRNTRYHFPLLEGLLRSCFTELLVSMTTPFFGDNFTGLAHFQLGHIRPASGSRTLPQQSQEAPGTDAPTAQLPHHPLEEQPNHRGLTSTTRKTASFHRLPAPPGLQQAGCSRMPRNAHTHPFPPARVSPQCPPRTPHTGGCPTQGPTPESG